MREAEQRRGGQLGDVARLARLVFAPRAELQEQHKSLEACQTSLANTAEVRVEPCPTSWLTAPLEAAPPRCPGAR